MDYMKSMWWMDNHHSTWYRSQGILMGVRPQCPDPNFWKDHFVNNSDAWSSLNLDPAYIDLVEPVLSSLYALPMSVVDILILTTHFDLIKTSSSRCECIPRCECIVDVILFLATGFFNS